MSITVTAVKARQNLGELLNLVSIKHEDVIIERAGKKIARLTAIDDSTVNEPVAEAYAVKKKGNTNSANRLRTIDPGVRDTALAMRIKTPLADIPEGVVPQHPDILDLCGLGKEMWESTGLTPDEYVRKEREEWD